MTAKELYEFAVDHDIVDAPLYIPIEGDEKGEELYVPVKFADLLIRSGEKDNVCMIKLRK